MLVFIAAVLLLTVFLVFPGFFLACCSRFRPLPALALGAPITAGLLAVAAQLFAWIHVPWNRFSVGTILCFILLFAGLITWRGSNRHSGTRHTRIVADIPPACENTAIRVGQLMPAISAPVFSVLIIVAFAFAGFIQFMPFIQTLPNLASPSQSFDAMFHVSAIRAVYDDGAAPWQGALDRLYPGKSGIYYPSQWASLLALFLPDASPTFISNAMLMVLALVQWPFGVALLADYAFGQRSPAVPLSVAFSPMVLVFPYYLSIFQSLYPYALALAWWPAALWVVLKSADALAACRAGRHEHLNSKQISCYGQYVAKSLLGFLVVLATIHAHPSSFGFIAIAGFASLVNALVKCQIKPRWWFLAVAAALGGGLIVPLGLQRLGFEHRMVQAGDNLDVWHSLGAMLGLAHIYQDPWWLMLPFGAMGILGAVWQAVWTRDLRFIGIIVGIEIVVLAAKLPLGTISMLTSLWYGAYDRVGSGLAVLVPVFTAGGVVLLALITTRWVRRKAARIGAASVIAVLLAAAVTGLYSPHVIPDRVQLAKIAYVPGSQFHPSWVTTAEFQALVALKLPENAKLLGDPSTGVGLAYGANGTDTFFKQLNPTGFSPDQKYLAEHFREIHDNPQVCAILRREKITHFYNDATGVGEDERFTYPGLHDVDLTRGFVKVATLDQAAVYRIEACQ